MYTVYMYMHAHIREKCYSINNISYVNKLDYIKIFVLIGSQLGLILCLPTVPELVEILTIYGKNCP